MVLTVCSRRGGGCGPSGCGGGAAGLGRGCAGPAWLPAEDPQPEPGAAAGLKQHFVSRPLPVLATPAPTRPPFLPASPSSCRGCPGDQRESAAHSSPWLSKGGRHHGPLGWAGQTQHQPALAHLRGCSGGCQGHGAEHCLPAPP